MNTELISVIVPVYKTERYLARCVESIVSQSFKNTEIILVDDGSPDSSPALCDEMAQKYSNVRVLRKENGGLSSARNAGIEAARGKYISFVDSDDLIEENMLQRLYTLAERFGADISMVKYAEVTEGEALPRAETASSTVYIGKDIERAFLTERIDSVCVGLYRRDAIGQTRFLHGKTSEDIPFNFEMFRKIRVFVLAPEKRYYYFYHSDSISNGALDKNMFNYLFFRREIYKYYKKNGSSELCRLAEALYARAAMGLLTRMAVYGSADGLDETECKSSLRGVLRAHKNAFFSSKYIPLSRKALGLCGLYAFPALRLAGRIKG